MSVCARSLEKGRTGGSRAGARVLESDEPLIVPDPEAFEAVIHLLANGTREHGMEWITSMSFGEDP